MGKRQVDADKLVAEFQTYADEHDDRVAEGTQDSDNVWTAAIEAVNRAAKESGWIPASERLPENANHKGELCPRVLVATKGYGVTEGWFNPDHGCWYGLIWTMGTEDSDDIDMEGGDQPEVADLGMRQVIAWMPYPEYTKEDEHAEDSTPTKYSHWTFEARRKFISTNINDEVAQKKDLGYGGRKVLNLVCSNCGSTTMVDATIRYRYCPHCGAIMSWKIEGLDREDD